MKRWLVVALLATACSSKPKPDPGYDDPGRRADMLEATLRAMDEHPEYVDEMYRLTLRHPRTLQRMLDVAARSFADDDIASVGAQALVDRPRGLERTLVATMDAAKDNPAAQRAIVDGIQQRSDAISTMLVNSPRELGSILKSVFAAAWQQDETKTILQRELEQVRDPKAAARNAWRPKR